jgi:hypothetical protein
METCYPHLLLTASNPPSRPSYGRLDERKDPSGVGHRCQSQHQHYPQLNQWISTAVCATKPKPVPICSNITTQLLPYQLHPSVWSLPVRPNHYQWARTHHPHLVPDTTTHKTDAIHEPRCYLQHSLRTDCQGDLGRNGYHGH